MKKPVFRKPSAPPAAEPDTTRDTVGATDESAGLDGLNGTSGGEEYFVTPDEDGMVSAQPPASAQSTSEEAADPVARAVAEAKENYDKYLRAVADLENFKKRSAKERSDLLKYAAENLGRDMLEIADNLQLAFNQDTAGVDPEFLKGIKLIYDRFLTLLEQHGIRGQSALGEIFDPNKQQALASVPTGEKPPGTILEEFKKAYFYKDKLLRPGQVVVAAAAETETASE